jgi:protein-tyrosine phosphatase
MAQAILSSLVARRAIDAQVASAGLLPGGQPMPKETLDALIALGYDSPGLRSFRSHQLSAPAVAGADLVLGLTREHVREIIVHMPESWERTFTLKELVRRGMEVGTRVRDEDLPDWLAKASAGRNRSNLLGWSDADDVMDPIGVIPSRFDKTAVEIDDLCKSLADLLWPASGP